MVKLLLENIEKTTVSREFLEITKEQFKLLEFLEKEGWLGDHVECILVALEESESSIFHRI